ncbi:hypothetical protein AB0A77_05780 [Streptomyces varsoviensis]|uniref:hypothetical protein n=1 Tax=Streptomyces varsoviensis TaxID=67373 RepID=UPI0033C3F8B6
MRLTPGMFVYDAVRRAVGEVVVGDGQDGADLTLRPPGGSVEWQPTNHELVRPATTEQCQAAGVTVRREPG